MKSDNSIFFSIIVRVYNAEKYLSQCIESVINQKYQNWELVLVDDGSTDTSLSICREYENNDKRIKAITQKNQGGVAAQLTGFKNSTGNYICGLDADDWYEENLLETCYKYIIENDKLDLILFGYNCLYENATKSIFSMTDTNQILNTEQLIEFIMKKTPHALWLKVFKNDVIKYTDFEKN